MKKILEIVWITLIGLTIFAYLLGYLKYIDATFVPVLLVSTFIKGFLVIEHFMDLKNVQGKYRYIPTIWLGVVLGLIAIAYFLPV